MEKSIEGQIITITKNDEHSCFKKDDKCVVIEHDSNQPYIYVIRTMRIEYVYTDKYVVKECDWVAETNKYLPSIKTAMECKEMEGGATYNRWIEKYEV